MQNHLKIFECNRSSARVKINLLETVGMRSTANVLSVADTRGDLCANATMLHFNITQFDLEISSERQVKKLIISMFGRQ